VVDLWWPPPTIPPTTFVIGLKAGVLEFEPQGGSTHSAFAPHTCGATEIRSLSLYRLFIYIIRYDLRNSACAMAARAMQFLTDSHALHGRGRRALATGRAGSAVPGAGWARRPVQRRRGGQSVLWGCAAAFGGVAALGLWVLA
jgi:hypothetical protein